MKWVFTLQKQGSELTVRQQENIKKVIEDYGFINFKSLKSIELVDINNHSFAVNVEATDNKWVQPLSRLLEMRANLFEHKEADEQLFVTGGSL